MTTLILMGSDPEIMGIDAATGRMGSFSGRLGCDKWNKRVVDNDLNIQEDNVLIEFDIAPHKAFSSFNANMLKGIAACESAAKEIGMGLAQGVSSHVFTEEEIRSFGEGALVFGCEPDFNALTGMKNPRPAAANPGLRTAGGHVHIGFSEITEVNPRMQATVGVMCDYMLGLPSLLLDGDDRRRELYGKAGAVRYKDYGIEYRTLSNFWIFEERMRRWVWEQTHKAMEMALGDYRMLVEIAGPEDVQMVINTGDKARAEQMVRALEINV